jgi:hypothetical protein
LRRKAGRPGGCSVERLQRGGGGGVSEEVSGIELLLSEPEIVAWLEPEEIGEGDSDSALAEVVLVGHPARAGAAAVTRRG